MKTDTKYNMIRKAERAKWRKHALLTGEASSLPYAASGGDTHQPSHWVAGLGGQATLPGYKALGGLLLLGSDNNVYYSGMEGLILLLCLATEKKTGPSTNLMVWQGRNRC